MLGRWGLERSSGKYEIVHLLRLKTACMSAGRIRRAVHIGLLAHLGSLGLLGAQFHKYERERVARDDKERRDAYVAPACRRAYRCQ